MPSGAKAPSSYRGLCGTAEAVPLTIVDALRLFGFSIRLLIRLPIRLRSGQAAQDRLEAISLAERLSPSAAFYTDLRLFEEHFHFAFTGFAIDWPNRAKVEIPPDAASRSPDDTGRERGPADGRDDRRANSLIRTEMAPRLMVRPYPSDKGPALHRGFAAM